MMRLFHVLLTRGLAMVVIAGGAIVVAQSPSTVPGVLLLAHGGSPAWNAQVNAVAEAVATSYPVEVAFGMASRGSIEHARDRLAARGATRIVVVPLFVSSWSSVIRSTEFLLGLRPDAPSDLAIFARMAHGAHAGGGQCHAPCDPTLPMSRSVPLRLTAALDRHPLVGAILADRARSISRVPSDESVMVVAHGPVPDDDNRRWLADMAVLAEQARASAPFAAVDTMTLRDDAGPTIRDRATAELRSWVTRETDAGRRVLIVPHLLSYGGIEQGIRKRLEGLPYTMSAQALMPDPRIVQWVLAQAATAD